MNENTTPDEKQETQDTTRQAGAQPVGKSSTSAKQPTLYALLKKDVSWQSIKDVLSYEIPMPISTQEGKDIADIALEQGWITEEQLHELRENRDAVRDSIGQVLLDRGIINAQQLEEAQQQKKRTGQPLYRTLMQLKMALPQDVVDVLSTPIRLPFGNRPRDKFCTYLIDQNILTEDELDAHWKAASSAKEEFRHRLLKEGKVTEVQYASALAYDLDLPFDSLEEVMDIPPRIVRMLPPFLLRRHQALPYKLVENTLHVAFKEAHHVHEFAKMGLLLESDLQPVIAPASMVDSLMESHVPKDDSKLAVGEDEESVHVDESGSVTPAVELVTVIVRGVLKSEGTDIHIEPQKDAARVRYRVDGILHDVMTLDLSTSRKVISRIKSLAGMDIAQRHLPQDGHLILTVQERQRNFRISTIPTIYGEKIAMRLVQSDMASSSFEQLGMTAEQRKLLSSILSLPNGLVVTTGPVGSGKTTTLYSCLNALDCFTHNIVAIEDPVEFDIAGINQMQVNLKRGVTFALGLRAILRQDPDVIMVGEIRDDETAEIAVRAAMTGSLVLSTIHANSATTCISSFIQLGVRPFMVSHAVAGIIFQRLVRRVCAECKEAYDASAKEKEELGIAPDKEVKLHRGKGCSNCLQTGYHGRIGVYEILKLNDSYRQAIVDDPSLANLKKAAFDAEMIPLRTHIIHHVLEGTTSFDEMLRIL